MKFIILGSGGCVCTPKPLCQCNVCVQAREKGFPYARCGVSLYLEDIAMLIDTPEDIAVALNNADVKAVDSIMYSHWDPDHTLGMRIMEQLRLEWSDFYDGIKPENPINVYASAETMNDINAIQSKFGSFLGYYESINLIKRQVVDAPIEIGDIKITLVPTPENKGVSVFVFESKGKKLIYAPCDCTPFPEHELLHNADMLIIGDTVVDDVGKNGMEIGPDHPLRDEFHSFEEILALKQRLNIKHVIITHLEEIYGKTYDDYCALEKQYQGVQFAYDGMKVEL